METNDPQIRRWLEAVRTGTEAQRGTARFCPDEDYSTSGRAEEQRHLPEGMAEVYQLKLTLEGSKPPIWRRLWLPAAMSLAAVHEAILIAMPWNGDHLHHFMAGNRNSGPVVYFSDPSMMGLDDCLDEAKARLDAVLVRPKDRLRYEYDFGDGWLHRLVLEKILVQPSEVAALPRCVGGRRACPPDDTGGLAGWEFIQEVLRDPSHPDHAAYAEVFDLEFDPEAFDLEAINAGLRASFAPKPKRGRPRQGV